MVEKKKQERGWLDTPDTKAGEKETEDSCDDRAAGYHELSCGV